MKIYYSSLTIFGAFVVAMSSSSTMLFVDATRDPVTPSSTVGGSIANGNGSNNDSSYVTKLQDLSTMMTTSTTESSSSTPFFAFCGAPKKSTSDGDVVEGCLAMSRYLDDRNNKHKAVLGSVEDQHMQHWKYEDGYLKTTGIFDPDRDDNVATEYCLAPVIDKIHHTGYGGSKYAVQLMDCPTTTSDDDVPNSRRMKWLFKPQNGQIQSLIQVERNDMDVDDNSMSHSVAPYCLTWSGSDVADESDDSNSRLISSSHVLLEPCSWAVSSSDGDIPTDESSLSRHDRQRFVAIGTAKPFVTPLLDHENSDSSSMMTVHMAYFGGIQDGNPADSGAMSLLVTSTADSEMTDASANILDTVSKLDQAGIVDMSSSLTSYLMDDEEEMTMTVTLIVDETNNEFTTTSTKFSAKSLSSSSPSSTGYSCGFSSTAMVAVVITIGAVLVLAVFGSILGKLFQNRSSNTHSTTSTSATTVVKPGNDEEDDDAVTVHSDDE